MPQNINPMSTVTGFIIIYISFCSSSFDKHLHAKTKSNELLLQHFRIQLSSQTY